MAETNLDDFFAKKDKSKKKSKSKTSPSDRPNIGFGDYERQEPESKPKKEKKKKDKEKSQKTQSSSSTSGLTTSITQKDDDEWKDFEEEKAKDYSGLRIQNLQITSKDEEEENEEEFVGEEGEVKERKGGSQLPWVQSGQQPAPTQRPASPVNEEEKSSEDSAPQQPKKYVPPGARAAMAGGGTSDRMNSRKKKEAPNISSEQDFPTLGGRSESNRCYRETQSQNYGSSSQRGRGPELSLENKFSALQD